MSSRVQPNQDLGTPCRGAINQIKIWIALPNSLKGNLPFRLSLSLCSKVAVFGKQKQAPFAQVVRSIKDNGYLYSYPSGFKFSVTAHRWARINV